MCVADGKLLISILFRESMHKIATPLCTTHEGLRQNILETVTGERAAGRPVSLVSSYGCGERCPTIERGPNSSARRDLGFPK